MRDVNGNKNYFIFHLLLMKEIERLWLMLWQWIQVYEWIYLVWCLLN